MGDWETGPAEPAPVWAADSSDMPRGCPAPVPWGLTGGTSRSLSTRGQSVVLTPFLKGLVTLNSHRGPVEGTPKAD